MLPGRTYMFLGCTYTFPGHTYMFLGHTYTFLGHTYMFPGQTYMFLGHAITRAPESFDTLSSALDVIFQIGSIEHGFTATTFKIIWF